MWIHLNFLKSTYLKTRKRRHIYKCCKHLKNNKNFHINKLKNLDKVDKFLENNFKLIKKKEQLYFHWWNQISDKNHPTIKISRHKSFIGKFYQTLKEAMRTFLHELFRQEKRYTPQFVYEASRTLIPKPKARQKNKEKCIHLTHECKKILKYYQTKSSNIYFKKKTWT